MVRRSVSNVVRQDMWYSIVRVKVSLVFIAVRKKEQSGGKVFALAGVQTTNEDNLIRGTCFINSTHLIAIIDTGATHSFISAECVSKLNLTVSNLKGKMVIVS